jgi:branched-chain amino acid transport system substrate-binding protein
MIAALAALAVAALAGLALGGGAPRPYGAGPVRGHVLRIYASQPLQGALAGQGRDIVRAEELALAQAGGRVRRWRIAYTPLDDASPASGLWAPGLVATNARTATQDPATIAYLGDMDTGASAVSIPILNEQGILQVSPLDGTAGLTRHRGVNPAEPDKYYPARHRNFVRLVPPDDLQAGALLALMRARGVHSVYVVDDETLYGETLALALRRAAPAYGIVVVQSAGVDPAGLNPSAIAAGLAASGAGAFAFAGGFASALVPALYDAVHAAAPRMPLFATGALAVPAFARALGAAGPRTWLTAPWLPEAAYPTTARQFYAYFRARYGAAPAPAAIYGYEAMRLVLAAIRRAKRHGNDRGAVIAAAFGVRHRRSPLGTYSVHHDGDVTLRLFGAYRVRGGRLAFVGALAG